MEGAMKEKDKQKVERLYNANELIKAIGTTGRKFFNYPNKHGLGRFELGKQGSIWFVDGYTGKRIYLNHKYWQGGFSEGGTLRDLINDLKNYITNGKKFGYPERHFGPWPMWLCEGDLWGYGDEDMGIVRKRAIELGITVDGWKDD